MTASRRSAPFDRSRPTSVQGQAEERADISLAVRELEQRGVTFTSKPHLIAPMEDHDLWMAFFEDLDGHIHRKPQRDIARTFHVAVDDPSFGSTSSQDNKWRG